MALSPLRDVDGELRLVATHESLGWVLLIDASGEVSLKLPFSPSRPATIADLDGDGRSELLLAGRRELLAFSPYGSRIRWRQEASNVPPPISFGAFTSASALEFVNGSRAAGNSWRVPVFDAATGGRVAEVAGSEGLVRIVSDRGAYYRLVRTSQDEWRIERWAIDGASAIWSQSETGLAATPELQAAGDRLIVWTDERLRVRTSAGEQILELSGKNIRSPSLFTTSLRGKAGSYLLVAMDDRHRIFDLQSREKIWDAPAGPGGVALRETAEGLVLWTQGSAVTQIRLLNPADLTDRAVHEDRFAPMIGASDVLVVDSRRIRSLEKGDVWLDLSKLGAGPSSILRFAEMRDRQALFVLDTGEAFLWTPCPVTRAFEPQGRHEKEHPGSSLLRAFSPGPGRVLDWRVDGDRLLLVRPDRLQLPDVSLPLDIEHARWLEAGVVVQTAARLTFLHGASRPPPKRWQGGSATDF